MHRHLHRVRSLRPAPSAPRPAKVVQLEARRLARLESPRPHLHPQPPKAA